MAYYKKTHSWEKIEGIALGINWSDMFLFALNQGKQWWMQFSWWAELRRVVSTRPGFSGLRSAYDIDLQEKYLKPRSYGGIEHGD